MKGNNYERTIGLQLQTDQPAYEQRLKTLHIKRIVPAHGSLMVFLIRQVYSVPVKVVVAGQIHHHRHAE